MPNISKSAAYIPASAIRMLSPYANKAESEGIRVYHLNIGAPDIKSPEQAVKTLEKLQLDHFPYSDSSGFIELRRALAEKYYPFIGAVNIGVDDILITTAASEALSFVYHGAFDPGDEVIMMEPFYCNYTTLSLMNGVKAIGIHTDIHDGFALPPASEIEAAITPRTKAILICNPSNPTGTLYTKNDMLAIADICRRHDLFLISDEAYKEFCYTDEPYFSALQIEGLDDNVILIDSFSKRYNFCGLRLGTIVCRNKALMDLFLRFAQARLCPPILAQHVALGALEAGQEYFRAVREEYIARRNFTVGALNAIPGVFSPMPEGAFYTVAELPVDDATDFCRWLLSDFRLDGETVMLTPAEPFYTTPGAGRNQVRVAYVLEIPALRRAMEILAVALDKYNSR